jgi:hypothetical protein
VTPGDVKKRATAKSAVWPNAIPIGYDEIISHIRDGRNCADSIAAYYRLSPSLLGYNDTCWVLVEKLRLLEERSVLKRENNNSNHTQIS